MYRETTKCFLLYGDKLVCRDRGHYLAFPGGGLDPGETILRGARRECMEEVGAHIGRLTYFTSVRYDWCHDWADTATRRERYGRYKGERVHLLVGRVLAFSRPTSAEGDEWPDEKLLALQSAIDLFQKYRLAEQGRGGQLCVNMAEYRAKQAAILQKLNLNASKV